MTNRENLMVVAMEECSELAKAISKCLRFGTNNGNEHHVWTEFHQLQAMMEMLSDNNVITPLSEDEARSIIEHKKAKVQKYAIVSASAGYISEEHHE